MLRPRLPLGQWDQMTCFHIIACRMMRHGRLRRLDSNTEYLRSARQLQRQRSQALGTVIIIQLHRTWFSGPRFLAQAKLKHWDDLPINCHRR
jgi:hypothetical protein